MSGATPLALQAKGLSKHFGGVPAADNLNIDVPQGAVYSLIGSNGAGKTTFVNMVTGYIKPDAGQIEFEGQDITRLGPRDITRLGVCRSFQIPQLCNALSALDNMLIAQAVSATRPPSFWRPAHTSEDIERAKVVLERFAIAEFTNHLINELPAGVRKLLDIAMAMAGGPRLLLLDEPTSGVAAEEKYPLMDRVMEALGGDDVTVVFVEHDMDIVTRYSQRVLAFYEGRVIANDAPGEVLSDPDVQRYVTGQVAE